MKKFNFKTMLLLVLASCVFGVVVNVTTSLGPQTTITAQASKKLSQAQQIAKINAKLSKANRAAKNWIAYRESGYSYTARNGRCYGRYQLLRSYLHGNLSPVNVLIPTSPRATAPGSRPNGSGNIITGTNPIFLLDHTKKTTNY